VLQNFGQGAVALFFMVTGALFGDKIAKGFRRTDWWSLYVSRVFRLVPLFWFAFALVTVIVFARNGLTTDLATYADAAAKWLLFVDMPKIDGADAGRVVAYAPWTLPYEWICYFSLPFVAVILSRASGAAARLITVAVLAGLCAAAPRVASFLPPTVYWSLLLLIPFFFGMTAMILARDPVAARVLRSSWAALAGIAALLFEVIVFPASFAFIPYIFLFLFFAPIVAGNSYFGLFSARPSIVLGEASYGTYLLHGIVLFIALADAAPLMDRYGPAPFWLLLPVLAIVVVAAAIALHEWLEKPAIRFGRRFRAQPSRTAVTSTSTLNSGRVKPDTITSVEAKALPGT
jgi:peptidoglycan/LPS O-acetylase OafA/YrhL